MRAGTDLSTTEAIDLKKGVLGLSTIYEPEQPVKVVADLVFIHGLGGGSRKTWSYSSDLEYFWPQEWLPREPELAAVRIHTFGYNANWGERRRSAPPQRRLMRACPRGRHNGLRQPRALPAGPAK